MTKKMTIKIVLFILGLLVLFSFANKLVINHGNYKNPTYFSNYTKSGYYKFQPDIILESLNKGKTDVFTPLLEEPSQADDLHNSISWTQSEYLKIATFLSQYVWNEPLDLKAWKVYFVYFDTGCNHDLRGFNEFYIVYYKSTGVNDWKRKYTARFIEVSPWNGVVAWGEEDNFSGPLLGNWGKINLEKYILTAEQALEIAEQNGGKTARLRNGNNCVISVMTPLSVSNVFWDVNYSSDVNLKFNINAQSGKYKILN